jgi:hypothetical protein
VDHLDELLARQETVLRLRCHRLAAVAASRGCRLAATGCRVGQKTDPRRYLLWGTAAVVLGALAQELLTAARWGGYRPRYQQPRPRPRVHPLPRDGHRSRRLTVFLAGTVRGTRQGVGLAWRSWRFFGTVRRSDDHQFPAIS